jgi:hypothetical protein
LRLPQVSISLLVLWHYHLQANLLCPSQVSLRLLVPSHLPLPLLKLLCQEVWMFTVCICCCC